MALKAPSTKPLALDPPAGTSNEARSRSPSPALVPSPSADLVPAVDAPVSSAGGTQPKLQSQKSSVAVEKASDGQQAVAREEEKEEQGCSASQRSWSDDEHKVLVALIAYKYSAIHQSGRVEITDWTDRVAAEIESKTGAQVIAYLASNGQQVSRDICNLKAVEHGPDQVVNSPSAVVSHGPSHSSNGPPAASSPAADVPRGSPAPPSPIVATVIAAFTVAVQAPTPKKAAGPDTGDRPAAAAQGEPESRPPVPRPRSPFFGALGDTTPIGSVARPLPDVSPPPGPQRTPEQEASLDAIAAPEDFGKQHDAIVEFAQKHQEAHHIVQRAVIEKYRAAGRTRYRLRESSAIPSSLPRSPTPSAGAAPAAPIASRENQNTDPSSAALTPIVDPVRSRSPSPAGPRTRESEYFLKLGSAPRWFLFCWFCGTPSSPKWHLVKDHRTCKACWDRWSDRLLSAQDGTKQEAKVYKQLEKRGSQLRKEAVDWDGPEPKV